jgi:hypothetical protein
MINTVAFTPANIVESLSPAHLAKVLGCHISVPI